MSRLSLALAGAMLLLTAPASAQETPWVAVVNSQGRSMMSFAARTEPYRPGLNPLVGEDFTGDHDLRNKAGRVISGIGFYGWTEGSNVRVVLLVRVPAAGVENKFYSTADSAKLTLEEFAAYSLSPGASRTIDELRSATFKPLSIRIESKAPATQTTAPVSSATVRMIRKPVDVQFVDIENLHDVPLLEQRALLTRHLNR